MGVVHGDFRNGNLIVDPHGVRAVLDWELAHLGDPREDLGWLCARVWRFGAPAAVAGMGTLADLLDAYAHHGGDNVDPADLFWWQVLATLRLGGDLPRTGARASVRGVPVGRARGDRPPGGTSGSR